MWLQLIAAAIAADSDTLHADAAGAQFNVYTDEGITAWAPSARARVGAGKVTVGALWTADFVSGATPVIATDAVTSATPFSETRNGGTVDVEWAPSKAWSYTAALTGSTESDHQVVLGSAGAATALNEDSTRLNAGASVGWVQDGTRADPDLAGTSIDTALDLGYTQILGPTTTAALRVTGGYASCDPAFGCFASAYRYVPQGSVFLPERHPGTRAKSAASGSISQALGNDYAVHAYYRYYADTWQVSGHTGTLALAGAFFEGRGHLRVEGRGVVQSPASFWADGYAGPSEYRTADRELSGFTEWKAGLRARWNFFGLFKTQKVALDAHLARLWFEYPNYAALPERNGWIVGGGFDAVW
ncbi:MAG: DUF3570 domain-containing protein [Deltaproteobacteria bacterium]|nr:DUF3570 domain-containing protein [Deltaproteobacteria bacterium]